MIEVENLRVDYGEETALYEINLEIEKNTLYFMH